MHMKKLLKRIVVTAALMGVLSSFTLTSLGGTVVSWADEKDQTDKTDKKDGDEDNPNVIVEGDDEDGDVDADEGDNTPVGDPDANTGDDDENPQVTTYVSDEVLAQGKLEGDGTRKNPFLIKRAEDLIIMRLQIKKKKNFSKGRFYKLTKDIDISGYCNADEANGWKPIGEEEEGYFFSGDFNGCDHTISGLNINMERDHVGFFGIEGEAGKIRNLKVEGKVKGNYEVGGIVGVAKGVVEYCSFNGTVIGTDKRAGGIVGFAKKMIYKCSFNGTVSEVDGVFYPGIVPYGNQEVGGIAGSANGAIVECEAQGNVSGYHIVGGIVGMAWGDRIEKCTFKSGTVRNVEGGSCGGIIGQGFSKMCWLCETTDEVEIIGIGLGTGGIVGQCANPVTKCVNRAYVTGTFGTGGIAGQSYSCGDSHGIISLCRNEGKIDGQQRSAGGIVGEAFVPLGVSNVNKGQITGNPPGDLMGRDLVKDFSTASIIADGNLPTVIVIGVSSILLMAVVIIIIKRKRKTAAVEEDVTKE